MMGRAYYNEHDTHAAAWLRELIAVGVIAPGDVDERSILDVRPDDLADYTQLHLFAGIGVWSYALRCAGWPDDRSVCTVSCPCQPFSAAGAGAGTADERHLWPAAFHLVAQYRPAVVLGEQVASKAGLAWFDLVCADLEGAGYAVGASDLCAASVGAPHIRQRLYFVAHADAAQRGQRADGGASGNGGHADQCGATGLADTLTTRLQGRVRRRTDAGWDSQHGYAGRGGAVDWIDCDWLPCRDGKWRPTGRGIHPLVGRMADATTARRKGRAERCQPSEEILRVPELDSRGPSQPSLAPLADGPAAAVVRGGDHGVPVDPNATDEARVMRLRGYGNAIVAPLAQAFVETVMEVVPCGG